MSETAFWTCPNGNRHVFRGRDWIACEVCEENMRSAAERDFQRMRRGFWIRLLLLLSLVVVVVVLAGHLF